MFGAVVLGNQLTQELHPKGSSHLNSVTLVDSEDRAIATTAVESYVSLLDLPLLGTAELNKVDGITFRTHSGIEHRKVTGYTVTTETARVGDSDVQTPRLSLATSAPGATVEVSVRDNNAWLSEEQGSTHVVTAIDTSSQRRLADGGSCLESGACLYSRDELLRLDAASRRLEEGSFFARADVAAYQVELSGDLMGSLEGAREATLDGTYSDGTHRFRLRFEAASEDNRMLFTNFTSGESKLVTSEGSFVFSSSGRLVRCNEHGLKDINRFGVEGVAEAMHFDTVEYGAPTAGFIPFEASIRECHSLTTKQANLSTPEALERFPLLAGSLQHADKSDLQATKDGYFKLQSRRKLAASADQVSAVTKRKIVAAKARMDAAELVGLMTNPASGRHMTAEELSHPDRKRVLAAARSKQHASRKLGMMANNMVTHFDLWLATRMADSSAVGSDFMFDQEPAEDGFFTDVTTPDMGPDLSMDLSGTIGIRKIFAEWSGWHYFGGNVQVDCTGLTDEHCAALTLYDQCAGGLNDLSGTTDAHAVAGMCDGLVPTENPDQAGEVDVDAYKEKYPKCTCYFDTYFEHKEDMKDLSIIEQWEMLTKLLGDDYFTCGRGWGSGSGRRLAEARNFEDSMELTRDFRRLGAGSGRGSGSGYYVAADPAESCYESIVGCQGLRELCHLPTKDLIMEDATVEEYLAQSCVQAGGQAPLIQERELWGRRKLESAESDEAYRKVEQMSKSVIGVMEELSEIPHSMLRKFEFARMNPGLLMSPSAAMTFEMDVMKADQQPEECPKDPTVWFDVETRCTVVEAYGRGVTRRGSGSGSYYIYESYMYYAMCPEDQEGSCRYYSDVVGLDEKYCRGDCPKDAPAVATENCLWSPEGCLKEEEGDMGGMEEEGDCVPLPYGSQCIDVHPGGVTEQEPEDDPVATVPKPAAYAALLYKCKGTKDYCTSGKEYAVSFQALALDQPGMLFYILQKNPVYYSTDVDGAGDTVNFVTTDGMAMYTSDTFPCIAKLSNQIAPYAEDISWVTGHSLGGAAATLYQMVVDSTYTGKKPTLVTFGALPTELISTAGATSMNWPCSNAQFEADGCAGTSTTFVPASVGEVTGLRYFHKFDPAAGFYNSMMLLKHEVSSAYMLYDTEDNCPYIAPSVTTYMMGTLDGTMSKEDYEADTDGLASAEMASLGKLHKFLCSNYGVTTNGVFVDSDYYSYTTAFDPMPCKEALLSMAWAYVSTLPGVSYSSMPSEMWLPHETFQQCSETWFATVEAYTLTYVASALFEQNPAYQFNNPEADLMSIVMFYALFGIFWIHSSYPNYILSDVPGYGNGYGPDGFAYDSAVSVTSGDPLFEMAEEVAAK